MKMKKELNIEGSQIAIDIAQVADALAHPVRVSLLKYVKDKNKVRNDVCNKDLVAHFPYSQSSLSQHVKKLKDVGLFTVEQKDRFSFYSVDKKTLNKFITTLRKL